MREGANLARDGGDLVRDGQEILGAARNVWPLSSAVEARPVRVRDRSRRIAATVASISFFRSAMTSSVIGHLAR
jgi:hypothetical protein